jgi:hypothetical protein
MLNQNQKNAKESTLKTLVKDRLDTKSPIEGKVELKTFYVSRKT